jgi:hypothetical protein
VSKPRDGRRSRRPQKQTLRRKPRIYNLSIKLAAEPGFTVDSQAVIGEQLTIAQKPGLSPGSDITSPQLDHDETFQWVRTRKGEQFFPTERQGKVLDYLHKRSFSRTPLVHEGILLALPELKLGKVRDLRQLFKNRPGLFDALIERRGNMVRLKL